MIAEQNGHRSCCCGSAGRSSCDGGVTIELRAGLAATEVDRRVAKALRAGDVGARALAFYLVDLAERGAHQELGFRSIEHYAQTRYHICPPTTRCYLATGRALQELPEIDRAFCRGGLFWSQVRELVRMATPETETEWLLWAKGRPAREIASQARIRRKGERPSDPARRRIHDVSFQVAAPLNALQWAKWSTAREKMEAELGRPVSDSEMLEEAADLLLSTRSDGSVVGRMAVNDSHYQIVAIHDNDSGTVSIDVDGVPFAVTEADLDENSGPLCPTAECDEPTPLWLRREILARDRFRCCTCGCRKNLTVHHKRWRRYGGRTVHENLLTLCEDCHSLVHARLLRIQGSIDGGLRFLDVRGDDVRALRPPGRETMESTVVEMKPPQSDSRETTIAGYYGAPRLDSRETRLRSLGDFVGQETVVANLKRAAARARLRAEPLPHILLCGPPGLGKSSLGRALAAEVDAAFRPVNAPLVRSSEVLLRHLTTVRDRDILFLDEIHRLPDHVAETLYEAMEDRRISDPDGVRRVARFTLVGATTDEDLLPAALRSRFTIRQDLAYYDERDLVEILRRGAKHVGLEIDDEAAQLLARASRDTPRDALALLASVREGAPPRPRGRARKERVRPARGPCAITPVGVLADGLSHRLPGLAPRASVVVPTHTGRHPAGTIYGALRHPAFGL